MLASDRSIPIEQSTTKAIKKWIYCLKKIKSRSKRFPVSDIRCYFNEYEKNNNNNNVIGSE